MNASEMRDMSLEELRSKEKETGDELFNLKIRHSLTGLDNPLEIRKARRNLARIKTLIQERLDEAI